MASVQVIPASAIPADGVIPKEGSAERRRKIRKRITILGILMAISFLACAGMLCYPYLAEQYHHVGRMSTIRTYDERVRKMGDGEKRAALAEARAYNDRLLSKPMVLMPEEEELDGYWSILQMGKDGEMGYLAIPAIGTMLPIYHGSGEEALQVGAGHCPGSSFPVGGTGSHAVITGHTGLTTSDLFTDVSDLEEGDKIYISVLGDVLAYEVDQRIVVLPWQTEALAIDPEEDYLTLVTCYPYGVNTHRLLVRGHRVALPEGAVDKDGGLFMDHYKAERKAKWSLSDYMALTGFSMCGIGAVVLIVRNARKMIKKRKQKMEEENLTRTKPDASKNEHTDIKREE